MKITFGIVISREFSNFSFHSDAIHTFENLLSDGLLGFKSDLVETITITLVCLSPQFCTFYKVHRPKYYEDRTLKIRGSVTPEVRMYKTLKYPGALKKFEKEKLLQAVRDILIENSIISVHDSI